MGWSTSRPTPHPKYRTPEHHAYRAHLLATLRRDGYLICSAPECAYPDRRITNPNGSHPDGLTAGHNDDGETYRGPEHRRCNIKDASKRARARQVEQPPRRWTL